jgi:hypothetical protein
VAAVDSSDHLSCFLGVQVVFGYIVDHPDELGYLQDNAGHLEAEDTFGDFEGLQGSY